MNTACSNIILAGETNVGLGRRHNEDDFIIYTPPGGQASLAVVADGIGGHSGGEIASGICCREMLAAAVQSSPETWDENFLRAAVERANRKIFERNFAAREIRPMGCTFVAAVFCADRVIFASAGDSRLYSYRAGRTPALQQLTVDHRPHRREGRHSRKRDAYSSLVCRSLGTRKDAEIDLQCVERTADDSFLLCSDGLYSVLPDSVFAGVLASERSARAVTSELMRAALLAGASDNITLISVKSGS